jgi:tellurite methyltransferase
MRICEHNSVPRDWEQHYAETENLTLPPAALLVEVADLTPPGRALDLACGAGRNALYLAGLRWDVVAVDSSPAAMRLVRERAASTGLRINARVADLEAGDFAIEPSGYDLICDFFYLQRDLFAKIREGVRPGGLVAAEIHLRDDQPHRFVLEPGELRKEFEGWKILYYSEAARAGRARPTAAILARKA